MKYFFSLLAGLLWLSIGVVGGVVAQENANPNPNEGTSAAKTKNSKSLVPPERALPIRLTRFQTAPVIDGKLNDEAWKTATVFKDFYQTRPRNRSQLDRL